MNRHILLVSFLPPNQGIGSPIVLGRHLNNLELEGWNISIASPEHTLRNKDQFPSSWRIIPLSGRRWWWPPLRPQVSGLLNLRLPFWRWECEQYLGIERPCVILVVLWGIYPRLASYLAKSWDVPLAVIIHDQNELWAKSSEEYFRIWKRSMSVLSSASRIWPVSQELAEAYKIDRCKKTSVLYPIPARLSCDFVEWKSDFYYHPVFAYAGSLHPFQFPNLSILAKCLQRVNGKLLIIAPADNPTLSKLLSVCPNIEYYESFDKNGDVIKFLHEKASCILVSYSFSFIEQPWAKTSFPSKLIEFSKIGLPILIMSPRETAISNWAEKNKWLSYISSLDEKEMMDMILKIIDSNTWMLFSEQVKKFSLKDFNSDIIHSQFISELPIKY
jgi:hypothetical protein